jgi:hypothetical protein
MSRARYPEPPVKYRGDSDLHFATEWQVRSPAALADFDRGELTLAPQRVTFTGMRVLVDCPNVTAVGVVRKTFPWAIAAAVAAAAAAAVYLASPVPFTWRQMLPYVVAFIFLAACALQWREQWVEVTYSDRGATRRAYFRRKSLFGSGAARTRQLLAEVRAAVLPAGTAAQPP